MTDPTLPTVELDRVAEMLEKSSMQFLRDLSVEGRG